MQASGGRPGLTDTVGRRPGDALRIVAAAVLVAGLALAASSTGVSDTELYLFRLFHDVPDRLGLLLYPALYLGSAVAVAVAAGIALYLQRVRLAVALASAGAIAWAATRVIGTFVSRDIAVGLLEQVRLRGDAVAPFPSSHAAVIIALTVVVAPYLPHAVRVVVAWVAGVVAVAVLFAGTALPLGVAVGGLTGWWAGAAVTALVGAPGRYAGPRVVRDALEMAGIHVTDVRLVEGHLWGAATFAVSSVDHGDLIVRVSRQTTRRHELSTQVRRYLASLELFDRSGVASARHAVEHEAFLGLAAERSGVAVVPVLLARELPGRAALIAHRAVDGQLLSDVSDIDDDLLCRVWRQVGALHAARIAHRAMWPDAILIDRDGQPRLTSFGDGRIAAGPEQLAQDVAELLVGVAALVGPDRAARTAVEVLGSTAIEEALPLVLPLALPRRARLATRRHPELLASVRNAISEAVGVPPPETQLRIRATTVLGLLVAGGAIYVLLPQIGSFERLIGAVRGANWSWLAVSFLAGMSTAVAAAVSYWGSSTQPLPLGRTTLVQMAGAFAGRLTPAGVGGMGLNLLFLESVGLSRTQAVSTVALNTAGGVVVHAVLFGAAAGVLGLGTLQSRIEVPSWWMLAVGALVVGVAAGVVFGTRLGREKVVRPVTDAMRTLYATLRRPVRATALFGGSTGVTLFNAAAFLAAIQAFGGTEVSALQMTAVYIGGSALGQAAPTPGGLGTVEAALVAASVAVGMPSERAVAATLTFRLLTFWLPILPGMVAYRVLQARGDLERQRT